MLYEYIVINKSQGTAIKPLFSGFFSQKHTVQRTDEVAGRTKQKNIET